MPIKVMGGGRSCCPSCFLLLFHWRLRAGKAGGGIGWVCASQLLLGKQQWLRQPSSADCARGLLSGDTAVSIQQLLTTERDVPPFPPTLQLWSCLLLAEGVAPVWSVGLAHLISRKNIRFGGVLSLLGFCGLLLFCFAFFLSRFSKLWEVGK